jgi:DNA polymerase III subunit delta'
LRFTEIPGLHDIKTALIQSVSRNHVSHSQLFYGAEGGAQLALAIAYASYINCENRSATDSCGTCAACHKMDRLIHPDFHLIFPTIKISKTKEDDDKKSSSIDGFLPLWRTFLQENQYKTLVDWHEHIGADKNKQAIIPVEEARKIIQKVSLKAYEAEYKILLVWLPELMNNMASNAILKILEEPPAKTLFLMVCNDANKLLPTILSRTIMINIPLFDDADVMGYLEVKNITDSSRSKQVAYLAEGNMAKAMEIASNDDNDLHENFAEWMRDCFKPDLISLVKRADKFDTSTKTNQKQQFEYGISIFRDIFLWINGGKKLVRLEGAELQFVERFASVVNEANIEFITKELGEAHYNLERNARAKIIFLDLSLRMARVLKK